MMYDINQLSSDDLRKLVLDEKNTSHWNISKSSIQVCRDCEFRYMCSDDRVPIPVEGQVGVYKHETPCFYDPYQAIWANS